jgi:hypothetical protein
MSSYGYDLNDQGIFIDRETGQPAPTVEAPRPQFEELMPQALVDQHNKTLYPPPNVPGPGPAPT